jgi:putative endonuclease
MSTVETGRAAEQLAADYLEGAGYHIISRNWRNRWCEIDIVARRGPQIHIVEVKYRANTAYGYAAEYISRDKSARLIRAAAAWCQANRHDGPYQVDVITVEGALAQPQLEHLENVLGA